VKSTFKYPASASRAPFVVLLAGTLAASGPLAALTAHAEPQGSPPWQDTDRDRLRDEAVAKLQALLRIDTSNPPGNEAPAAELIATWLRAEGIEPKLYETAPGRKAVVARLKGSGAREALLLLNHLDVVPAEAEKWTHPPFSGTRAGNEIWGRGALDMKNLGVMQLVAFLELKRSGARLDRDVIFCATPDEEAGGEFGVGWLVKNARADIQASEVLNEGSMGIRPPDGKPLVGIACAERGALWVRLRATGKPGHGSLDRPNGATRKLLRAIGRLELSPRMWEVIPEAATTFKALAPSYPGLNGFVLGHIDFPGAVGLIGPILAQREPGAAALLSWTINTTVFHAGSKVNVMPSEAFAEVDIRMLPGHTTAEGMAYLRKHLDDPDIAIEVIGEKNPSRSAAEGPLFAALTDATRAEYPDATVTPVMTPGGSTDSSYFRKLGAKAYGLCPIIAPREQLDGFHGHNEFITVDQLSAGTRVLVRAIAAAATAPRAL
jgi:acetylornithine deacetylase/succinyl-diaminopimelate desuccinylase-like protein